MVRTLKIDRSFLKDIVSRPESRTIVKATAALGNSLGMITTAEGVETADQLRIVREHGFAEAQGYFFSVPLSVADATKLLKEEDGRWPGKGSIPRLALVG